MKRVLSIALLILVAAVTAPAQTKISDLPAGTPAATDVLPFVDLAGTPATKKTTLAALLADLIAIRALTPMNDDLLQRKGGAWTNRTPAQVKTDLALVKGDVGLGSVDNTSDASKPVSTATQAALDLKAAASHAHSAADTTSGTFAAARLGSGTPGAANYLRGDGAWSVPAFSELSGAATDAQVPNSITVDLATLATTATTANAGDSATAFFSSGTVEAARLGSGTADGTTYLRGDGTWATPAGGSPGGSTTQLQYNNAGAFGGISGATSDGTNVTFGSGNLRATAPVFSGTSAFRLAAGVAGTDEVQISHDGSTGIVQSKDGALYLRPASGVGFRAANNATETEVQGDSGTVRLFSNGSLVYVGTSSKALFYAPTPELRLSSDNHVNFSSTTAGDGAPDTGISRVAAGMLEINSSATGTQRDLKLRGLQYATGTRPTCNSTNRGFTWYVAGGAGAADTYEVCRKDAADAYAWVTLF